MTKKEFLDSELHYRFERMRKDWIASLDEIPTNLATRDVMFDDFYNKFTENFCSHEEKDIMDLAYRKWWIIRTIPMVEIRSAKKSHKISTP